MEIAAINIREFAIIVLVGLAGFELRGGNNGLSLVPGSFTTSGSGFTGEPMFVSAQYIYRFNNTTADDVSVRFSGSFTILGQNGTPSTGKASITGITVSGNSDSGDIPVTISGVVIPFSDGIQSIEGEAEAKSSGDGSGGASGTTFGNTVPPPPREIIQDKGSAR